MTQHSFSQVLRTEVFTCHYVKSRNILKQVEYLWISKKFNHSWHNISMYSRTDTPLLFFFKVTGKQSPLPGAWLGRTWRYSFGFLSRGTDGRWCLHPQFWWSLGFVQLVTPKFDPWSKGSQPSKSLKDFVMFQDHQDNFFWWHICSLLLVIRDSLQRIFWGQEHLQADFANAYLGGGVLSGGTRHGDTHMVTPQRTSVLMSFLCGVEPTKVVPKRSACLSNFRSF